VTARRRIDARRPPPPAGPVRRRFAISATLWWALLIGLWAGRLTVAAPAALQPLLDLALTLSLALLAALAYRRWARRQVQSRRARSRDGRSVTDAGRERSA
jgi:membrane protein implicated in regulation of membrane protease activity